jgi:hypothetical protein
MFLIHLVNVFVISLALEMFIDEKLQGINDDKNEPLLPSTLSPEYVPASTLGDDSSSWGVMSWGGDHL